MSLRRDAPHFVVCCKDGSSWLLPVSAREVFRAHWMNGRPFWSGVDLWGADVDIKLGDITGTVHYSAERIALREYEAEVERVREMVDGGDL